MRHTDRNYWDRPEIAVEYQEMPLMNYQDEMRAKDLRSKIAEMKNWIPLLSHREDELLPHLDQLSQYRLELAGILKRYA